jgi:hypothetical protein
MSFYRQLGTFIRLAKFMDYCVHVDQRIKSIEYYGFNADTAKKRGFRVRPILVYPKLSLVQNFEGRR